MLNKYQNNRSGFTLVELLVVIAIIGMIALITFVSSRAVLDKKTDTVIKSKLGEALIQSKLFLDDRGNYNSQTGATTLPLTTSAQACRQSDTLFEVRTDSVHGSQYSLYQLIRDAEEASDPSTNWVATCGVGGNGIAMNGGYGTSWAVAIPLHTNNIISSNSGVDYYCVDSSLDEGVVIDTLGQMTGYSFGEDARCN